jgi:hypothetical protein
MQSVLRFIVVFSAVDSILSTRSFGFCREHPVPGSPFPMWLDAIVFVSLLFQGRRRMAEGGKEAVRADEDVVGFFEVKALEARIRELERVLGKRTLEKEILREAVKVAHEKNV